MRCLCLLLCIISVTSGEEEIIQSVEIGTDGAVKSSAPVATTNLSVEFENQSGETVELYWDDSKDGILQSTLEHTRKTTVNTFLGHRFYFTPVNSSGDKAQSLYTVTMERHTARATVYDEKTMKERGVEFDRKKNLWMKEYFERTGRRWANYYPRGPITYHYYDVNETGQKITAETDRTQFKICQEGDLSDADVAQLDAMETEWNENKPEPHESCKDEPEISLCKNSILPPAFQIDNDRFYIGRMNGTTYCRPKIAEDGSNISIEITNICGHSPRAFRVYNFLSDDEMEHIKILGQFFGLKRSTVSEEATVTLDRTSQTVWLERSKSFIIDNVIRRIAHTVNIPQNVLFLNASSESLQLVHYFGGELYKSHVDYGTDRPHNRYVTFLMYLAETKGGNTSFPLADEQCQDENGYFGVQPVKGSVMFFYNLFPDGNVDPKTQHYAEPPEEGSEKWMTNLWIWDEIFQR